MLPLNVVPDASPVPLLLNVTELGVAEAPADVAYVAVAALPLMLMPHVPLAPEPVTEGTSVPMAKPRFERAVAAVVAPVPPLVIANVPVTPVAKLTRPPATFAKSEPVQAITVFSPGETVTPVVGPAPTICTFCDVDVALMTMYDRLEAGTVMVNVPAGLPVQLMMWYCADPVAPADPTCEMLLPALDPLVRASVTAVWLPLMVCVPAIAISR